MPVSATSPTPHTRGFNRRAFLRIATLGGAALVASGCDDLNPGNALHKVQTQALLQGPFIQANLEKVAHEALCTYQGNNILFAHANRHGMVIALQAAKEGINKPKPVLVFVPYTTDGSDRFKPNDAVLITNYIFVHNAERTRFAFLFDPNNKNVAELNPSLYPDGRRISDPSIQNFMLVSQRGMAPLKDCDFVDPLTSAQKRAEAFAEIRRFESSPATNPSMIQAQQDAINAVKRELVLDLGLLRFQPKPHEKITTASIDHENRVRFPSRLAPSLIDFPNEAFKINRIPDDVLAALKVPD